MNQHACLVVSRFGLFLPGAQPIGVHGPVGRRAGVRRREATGEQSRSACPTTSARLAIRFTIVSLNAMRSVGLEMFVPFVAGHLLQPWIGSWVQQRRKVLGGVDRGSVLLVV
jgi:hypothetical protein